MKWRGLLDRGRDSRRSWPTSVSDRTTHGHARSLHLHASVDDELVHHSDLGRAHLAHGESHRIVDRPLMDGNETSTYATGYNLLRANGEAAGRRLDAPPQIRACARRSYTQNDSTVSAGITLLLLVVQAYYQSWGEREQQPGGRRRLHAPSNDVQSRRAEGQSGSFSATFSATQALRNLLIVADGGFYRINKTEVGTRTAGWSTAINQTATPAPRPPSSTSSSAPQDPTHGDCRGRPPPATARIAIKLYEYRCVTTLDLASSATGSSTSVSSGSVTTTHPNSLIIAGLVARAEKTIDVASWTNPFSHRAERLHPGRRRHAVTVFGAADRIVSLVDGHVLDDCDKQRRRAVARPDRGLPLIDDGPLVPTAVRRIFRSRALCSNTARAVLARVPGSAPGRI